MTQKMRRRGKHAVTFIDTLCKDTGLGASDLKEAMQNKIKYCDLHTNYHQFSVSCYTQ